MNLSGLSIDSIKDEIGKYNSTDKMIALFNRQVNRARDSSAAKGNSVAIQLDDKFKKKILIGGGALLGAFILFKMVKK